MAYTAGMVKRVAYAWHFKKQFGMDRSCCLIHSYLSRRLARSLASLALGLVFRPRRLLAARIAIPEQTISFPITHATLSAIPRLLTSPTLAQHRARVLAPRTLVQLGRVRRPLGVRRLFRQVVVDIVPVLVPEIVQPRRELVFGLVAMNDVLVINARAVESRDDVAPFFGGGSVAREDGHLRLAEL